MQADVEMMFVSFETEKFRFVPDPATILSSAINSTLEVESWSHCLSNYKLKPRKFELPAFCVEL
jgi:hypothetical protein